MTEYWVSQGNKWCDFCKIYIANNPASIRTHEFGQRHKDSVAKRLADLRKSNASKEKEKQQALKDMDRIEAQAKRSYQKDLAASATAETEEGSSVQSTSGVKVASNTTVKIKSKGVPSSLQVGKRKRPEKTQPISKEEEDALKAREAAKKRIQEREKGLMGLYQAY